MHSIKWLPLLSTSQPFKMFLATFWQIIPNLSKAIMAGKDQIAIICVHGSMYVDIYIYICMHIVVLYTYRFLWPDCFWPFEWRYVKNYSGLVEFRSTWERNPKFHSWEPGHSWIMWNLFYCGCPTHAAAHFIYKRLLGAEIGFWGGSETSAQAWMKTQMMRLRSNLSEACIC